ncbi:acetyl-coenzyme A synthetase [Arthrobacter sp. Hiyo8]|nr:acetyl-coenzyme A synthetase [Arthrobacter sp. Hiyo8]
MSQDANGSTTTAAPGSDGAGNGDALENLLHENRKFAPTPEFAANAVVGAEVYAEANADRPAFWAKQARELLDWDTDFTEALDWSNPPFAKWFVGGKSMPRTTPWTGTWRTGSGTGGHPFRGRTGRHPLLHLRAADRRGEEGRQRFRVARCGQG